MRLILCILFLSFRQDPLYRLNKVCNPEPRLVLGGSTRGDSGEPTYRYYTWLDAAVEFGRSRNSDIFRDGVGALLR